MHVTCEELKMEERKKAEEELKISEIKYRSLVEDAGAGVATTDWKGRFTFVNKALCRMMGYSKEELIGKPFADFLHPDDKKKILKIFWKAFTRPKRGVSLEFRVVHKKGHIVHMYSTPTITLYKNKVIGFNAIITDITERKKAEEALRLSEEKYRSLVENIPIVAWTQDAEENTIFISSNVEKVIGFTPDEIYREGSRLWDEIIHPDDRERVEKAYNLFFTGNKMFDVEYRMQRKDGHWVWINDRAVATYEKDGVIYADGVCFDITKRKKAEEELIRLSSAVKTSTDSIVISDINGKILDVNEATLKMYGSDDKEDLIGKNSFSLIAPEEREKALAGAKDLLEKGYLKIREYHILTKNGNRIPVEMSAAIMKDTDGKPIGFVGISRDITERKKAEEALRKSQGRLNAMLQSIGDHMSMMDKDLNILWANEIAKKIFGGDVIGKKCYEVYHGRKKPCEPYPCLTLKAFQDGKVHEHDTQVIDKDGKIICFHCTANVALKDKEGKTTAVIEISRDVTERKQMEKKLEEYSQQLEELVEKRTRQLKEAQEQLLKSERLAAIGEVAAMVGHDLRNPLQSIENATYYLNNELSHVSIPQKAIEMLQIINKSVNYADRIIKDLQDFSATKKPVFKKNNINVIVKEVLSQFETPKNVKLITELHSLPEIKADKDMTKRVFLNLTMNGIQAMKNGGTLKISSKKTKDFVEISFKDTGTGMPKEKMEKLFTPFFTTKAKGMGMGLPICKKFVDAHHGNITVESEEGKGTTFTVKLPIQ